VLIQLLQTSTRAIGLLAMGNVVKLVLHFDRAFWLNESFAERLGAPNIDELAFLHSQRRTAFPVWWTMIRFAPRS